MGSASYPPCLPHPWLRFHSACVVTLSTISFADKPLSLLLPLIVVIGFSLYRYLTTLSPSSRYVSLFLPASLFLAIPRYPCHLFVSVSIFCCLILVDLRLTILVVTSPLRSGFKINFTSDDYALTELPQISCSVFMFADVASQANVVC